MVCIKVRHLLSLKTKMVHWGCKSFSTENKCLTNYKKSISLCNIIYTAISFQYCQYNLDMVKRSVTLFQFLIVLFWVIELCEQFFYANVYIFNPKWNINLTEKFYSSLEIFAKVNVGYKKGKKNTHTKKTVNLYLF